MHLVSHSKRYSKMRQRYPPDTLPSADPVVRELAEKYLSAVPVDKLYVIPKEDSNDNSEYKRRRDSSLWKTMGELSRRHRREWQVDDDNVTDARTSVDAGTQGRNRDRVGEDSYSVQERRKSLKSDSDEGSDSAPERRKHSFDSRDNKYGDTERDIKDKARNGEQPKDSRFPKEKRESIGRDRDREGSDRVQDKRKHSNDRGNDRARDGSDDRRRQSKGRRDNNRDGSDSDGVLEKRKGGREEIDGGGDREDSRRYPSGSGKQKKDGDRKNDRHAAEDSSRDNRAADRRGRGRRDEPRQRDRGSRETKQRGNADSSQVRCHFCKGVGHVANNCPSKKTRMIETVNISERSQLTPDIHMPVQEQISD